MKINYDRIQEILETMEMEKSYRIDMRILLIKLHGNEDILFNNPKNQSHMDNFIGHIKVLTDNNLIDFDETEPPGYIRAVNGDIFFNGASIRITGKGYDFLQAIREPKIKKKIKNLTIDIAIEVGKRALAAWTLKGLGLRCL